jgi:GNAT superfamily N-acetyltransferase/succinyl-CoA synthetase alpha subunit
MEHVLDRSGRILAMRDVGARDAEAVDGLLRRLSARSARQRFLGSSTKAGPRYAAALLDPAKTLDAVVVESGAEIVAVGSTHPLPDDGVEFALTVDDEHQGHGVGTLLMERLVARAQDRGVRSMVGTVLAANTQMFDLLRHLGLPWRSVVEDGVATVTVSLVGEPVLALPSRRSRLETARAEAVRPFLQPTGVALVAQSPATAAGTLTVDGPGVVVVEMDPVTGAVTVPVGTDLALIPQEFDGAHAAAMACAEAGVPAVAFLGTAQNRPPALVGHDDFHGAELDQLRDAGARVLGPGCRCLVNTDPLVRLRVGGGHGRIGAGSVAVITDDAACLDALRERLAARSMGVSVIVDVGSGADLGVLDVAAWVAGDSRTEVVLVKLAGDVPEELWSQLGRLHAAGKPVAILTGDGRPTGGALRGPDAGPVRAFSIDDLADLAMLLVLQGLPPGRRVAVVTNEPLTVHADANGQLARLAMLGPDLTQHTEMRLHFLSPGSTSNGAVVALPADTTARQVRQVLETLTDDPGVDALVIEHAPSPALRQHTLYQVLRGVSRGPRAPVLVAVDPHGPRDRGGVPLFSSVDTAVDALARVCKR